MDEVKPELVVTKDKLAKAEQAYQNYCKDYSFPDPPTAKFLALQTEQNRLTNLVISFTARVTHLETSASLQGIFTHI